MGHRPRISLPHLRPPEGRGSGIGPMLQNRRALHTITEILATKPRPASRLPAWLPIKRREFAGDVHFPGGRLFALHRRCRSRDRFLGQCSGSPLRRVIRHPLLNEHCCRRAQENGQKPDGHSHNHQDHDER